MKIGIIVEGFCERIILKSPAFLNFLQLNDLKITGDVVNLEGKGQLNTRRMETQAQVLRDKGAEWIFVLRDKDNAPCFTSVKQEVYQATDVKICVAVNEIEAWFLADSETLSAIFRQHFHFKLPESERKPYERLKELFVKNQHYRIPDKKIFTSKMVNQGFTVERAAAHPNCPSARYFLQKLTELQSKPA